MFTWLVNIPARLTGRLAFTVLAISSYLFTFDASATTVTLNLNALPTGPITSPLEIDGFTIRQGWGNVPYIVNVNGVNTIQDLINDGHGADAFITRTDGSRFSLISLEIAALKGDYWWKTYGVQISDIEDVANVQVNKIAYFSFHYGTPLSESFTTFMFSGWSNLKILNVDPVAGYDPSQDGGFAIRNITLSYDNVPEIDAMSGSGALTLLGFGLALSGELRRKSRNS